MRKWYEKLAARRRAKGLSQDDIEKIAGLSHKSVNRWEALVRPPRFHNLVTWARTLDVGVFLVPYDQTFTPDGRVAYAANDQASIVTALRQIREDSGLSINGLAQTTARGFTRQAISMWEQNPDRHMQVANVRTWARKLGAEVILAADETPLAEAWETDFTMVLPRPSSDDPSVYGGVRTASVYGGSGRAPHLGRTV